MKRRILFVPALLCTLMLCSCQLVPGAVPPTGEPSASSTEIAISNSSTADNALDDVSEAETISAELEQSNIAPTPPSSEKPVNTSPESSQAGSTVSTISSQADKPEQKPVNFKGETVLSLYSLDYANRLYHPVGNLEKAAGVLAGLEEMETDTDVTGTDRVGFLVFTDKAKYAYYLDAASQDESQKDLIQASKNHNSASTGIAQWLAYMSTSNITNVKFSGECGPGFSLKKWTDQKSFHIDVDTNDPASIQAVGSFLKSMTVNAKPEISAHTGRNWATNDGEHFSIILNFSSGTKYGIEGSHDWIYITSSDMQEDIIYQCTSDVIKALRDCMAGLTKAVKSPGIWG